MISARPSRSRFVPASSRRAAAPRSGGRSRSPWRLLRLGALALGAAYLVALHAELLWQRIASQTLLEPLVALKWGAAAALVVALLRLQSAGVSLWRGRRAVVFWMLVLLLHAGAAVPAAGELAADLADQAEAGLLFVLPLCASVATVFELGRRLLDRRATARPAVPGVPRWLRFEPPSGPAFAHGFGRVLSSRPPPVRSVRNQ